MKNFIICVLIVLCISMFTGAWRGDFTNPFWGDMVFKKNVTVTDTLYIGDNKMYQSGGYIKTPFSFQANNISALTLLMATTLKNNSTLPLIIDFGYNANDSIPFVMKGFGGDTVIDVDSFNYFNIRKGMQVASGDIIKNINLTAASDSLLFVVGTDTFVALKK